jgi:hypothetical protein
MSIHTSRRFVVAALTLASSHAYAALDCTKDVDECARTLVAETAGFVTACGNGYPAAKDLFDRAFKNWPVLKLQIPGLAKVLDPASSLREQFTRSAADYLTSLAPDKREAECTARLAALTTPEPTLRGSSAQLPPNALKAYAK